MEDLDHIPDKDLKRWVAILTSKEYAAIDRLAQLACLFLIAVIEQELARRATK